MVQVITGTLGNHEPSRSITASMRRVWLAIRIFGTNRCAAHRCKAGDSDDDVDAWCRELLLGEANAASPPPTFVRLDQSARDQWRALAAVADRADEAEY